MRKSISRKGRHVTDAFRTVCWFHALRIASGAKSTYQMDVLLEAPLTQSVEAPIDRKSAWRSYRKGRHTPSLQLVAKLEALHPGTEALLNHPVWPMLRLDRPVRDQIPNLLVQMPPSIYGLVRGESGHLHQPTMRMDGWSESRLRRLQSHAGLNPLACLNSLACLVALLRLSVEAGAAFQAFVFSRALCRTLLMMGPWLYWHGIAQPLADYVENQLLPLATCRGWQHGFGEGGFLSATRRLDDHAVAVEGDLDVPPSNKDMADLRLDLLEDRYTVELSELILTIPGATGPPDPMFRKMLSRKVLFPTLR